MQNLNTYIREALVKGHYNTQYDSDYVDLGLIDGALWATCNIGAKHPWEYGDYYAWGDTDVATNKKCDWDTYKFCKGSHTTLTKYCKQESNGDVDNKTELDEEDDTALFVSNGKFKMPTEQNFKNLLDGTTQTWTNDHDVNGVLFESKKNNNSIFIPAAGIKVKNVIRTETEYASVWSSSLDGKYLSYVASQLLLSEYSKQVTAIDRCRGASIRPILNR